MKKKTLLALLYLTSLLQPTLRFIAMIISLGQAMSHLGPCPYLGRPYFFIIGDSLTFCACHLCSLSSIFAPFQLVVFHSGMLCYSRKIDPAIPCVLHVLVRACPHRPQHLANNASQLLQLTWYTTPVFLSIGIVLNYIAHIPSPFVSLACYTNANWSHHSFNL